MLMSIGHLVYPLSFHNTIWLACAAIFIAEVSAHCWLVFSCVVYMMYYMFVCVLVGVSHVVV